MTPQRMLSVKVSTSVEPPWPSPTLSLFLALSNPATLLSALYFSFLFLLWTKKKDYSSLLFIAKFSPFHWYLTTCRYLTRGSYPTSISLEFSYREISPPKRKPFHHPPLSPFLLLQCRPLQDDYSVRSQVVGGWMRKKEEYSWIGILRIITFVTVIFTVIHWLLPFYATL